MKKKVLIIIGLALTLLIPTGCQKDGDIKRADDWKDKYPDVYASYLRNSEMEETTFGGSVPVDYLEEYPNLKVFYDGYGFSKEYLRARGHTYGLEDVINTERPKPGASCLACKTADFIQVLEKDGVEVNKLNFEDFVSENSQMETISCYDCHKNKPGEVNITRTHLSDALNHVEDQIASGNLACAQCHVEYYLDSETKEVILPWHNGLETDGMLEYYDDIDFKDWVHPTTGADLLKAQHPETETYEGSVHDAVGLSCIDCHMPEIEGENKSRSHQWTSPLKFEEGIKQSCISCHGGEPKDLVLKVEDIQRAVYNKQQEVSDQLLDFVNRLSTVVKEGSIEGADLEKLQDIHRKAQFKWDFVFVENSEGFHNSNKSHKNLEEAGQLIKEGIEILEKYNK